MVWQPNILNNCYELSGGYAPEPPTRGSAPGPRWGTSVPQTPVPHLQILATPLQSATDTNRRSTLRQNICSSRAHLDCAETRHTGSATRDPICKISHDNLTIRKKLRSTYDQWHRQDFVTGGEVRYGSIGGLEYEVPQKPCSA